MIKVVVFCILCSLVQVDIARAGLEFRWSCAALNPDFEIDFFASPHESGVEYFMNGEMKYNSVARLVVYQVDKPPQAQKFFGYVKGLNPELDYQALSCHRSFGN